MSYKKLLIIGVLSTTLSTPAFSMSKNKFFQEFAECSYPYFEAGLKWNLDKEVKKKTIKIFATKLSKVISIDMALSQKNLTNFRKNYENTKVPKEMSKSRFERTMRDNGADSVLKALKASQKIALEKSNKSSSTKSSTNSREIPKKTIEDIKLDLLGGSVVLPDSYGWGTINWSFDGLDEFGCMRIKKITPKASGRAVEYKLKVGLNLVDNPYKNYLIDLIVTYKVKNGQLVHVSNKSTRYQGVYNYNNCK